MRTTECKKEIVLEKAKEEIKYLVYSTKISQCGNYNDRLAFVSDDKNEAEKYAKKIWMEMDKSEQEYAHVFVLYIYKRDYLDAAELNWEKIRHSDTLFDSDKLKITPFVPTILYEKNNPFLGVLFINGKRYMPNLSLKIKANTYLAGLDKEKSFEKIKNDIEDRVKPPYKMDDAAYKLLVNGIEKWLDTIIPN